MSAPHEVPEMENAKAGIWVCPAHYDHIIQADRCPGPCPFCVRAAEEGKEEGEG